MIYTFIRIFPLFSKDHELVGIFMTTVPSAAVVISCGTWIWTGRVVLLLVTWKTLLVSHAAVKKRRSTYMNGNFLWQREMRHGNSPRHVVVSFLNTGRWAAGRNLLPLDRYLGNADILMVGMCRLFLRPLRYVRFDVFPQMILSIKAFAAFRTNLRCERLRKWFSRLINFA